MDFLLVFMELFSPDVTAEELRLKIDRKSAISRQRGQLDPKFLVEGVAPPIIFARIVRPINALELVADIFHTKNFCSRLYSNEVRFYTEIRRLAF